MKSDVDKLRREMLLERLLTDAADMLSDSLLSTCADHEYRLCLIELGIN